MPRGAVILLPLMFLAARGEAQPADDASPRGFLEMFVAGVVPSPEGHTLVLINAEEQVVLPLGIGPTEALAIHGRLQKLQGRRPMTHDLLDHIVAGLGGTIVRVQIDDLKDDIFTSSVLIRLAKVAGTSAGKVVSFDARASDAVAMALSANAPIYVARPVVDRAAIHPGDDAGEPPGAADDKGSPRQDDGTTPSGPSSPQPSVLSL